MKVQPALALGLVQAVIVLGVSFGLRLSPEQSGAILAVIAALTALLTRSYVSSPATAEILAKGTLKTQASPRQMDKAAEVLGVPTTLVQEAVKFAAQGLLPATWASLIVGTDYSALVKAVEAARRRAPSQDETNAKATGGL